MDPSNAQVPQKEQLGSKNHFGVKTALKVNSKKKLSMDHEATTKQKYSFSDVQERHASEIAKSRQDMEKREIKSLKSLAFFHFIKQKFSQIATQSISSLYSIAQKSSKKFIRLKFSTAQVSKQINQVYYQGYMSFYKHSVNILQERIKELIQTIILEKKQCSYDVRLQLLSLCLKQIQQFEICLDKQCTNYITSTKLEKLFALPSKKISFFNKLHKKHRYSLKYIEVSPQFQQLFSTYYLLSVKRDIFNASIQQDEATKQYIQKAKQEMRQRVKLRSSYAQQIQQNKLLLSQLNDDTAKRPSRKIPKGNPEDVIDILSKYEEIIQKGLKDPEKRRILERLGQKYERNHCKISFTRYEKWTEQNWKKYGKDLSEYKRITIGKYLNRNSFYQYEEIVMKAFYGAHVFIDRPFYEENILEILRKEVQYHQLVYFSRVKEGIELRKSEGSQIIFVDYYNSTGDEHAMKDESEDYSIIAAVGLNGSLSCKMYPGKIQSIKYFSEVVKMSQQNNKQLVIIYYDRDFPHSKWFMQEKTVAVRGKNCFYNFPKIEAVPNPSQKVCQLICKVMKEIMDSAMQEKPSLEAIFQQAVNFCQGKDIINQILEKQWEKVKEITFKKTGSVSVYNQQALEQKQESLQEHFDEETPQNVQRKLFVLEKDNPLSKQIDAEELQFDNQDQQSNQSGLVLSKMRDSSLQNSIHQGKKSVNSLTKLKKKMADSQEDNESHMSESSGHLSKDQIRKNDYQFQQSFVTYLNNHENKQIPIMENIQSMNQEQLRRFLPIITSHHCQYILPSFTQKK